MAKTSNSSSSNHDATNNDVGGWVTAGSKKKPTSIKIKTKTAPSNKQQQKNPLVAASAAANNPLLGNKFFVPKDLETKLHNKNDKDSKKKCAIPVESGKTAKEENQQQQSFLSIMGLSSSSSSSSPDSNEAKEAAATNKGDNNNNLKKLRKSHGAHRAKQRFGKQTRVRQNIYTAPPPTNPLFSAGKQCLETTATNEFEANLLGLPFDVLSRGILSFLAPKDLLSLGSCSKQSQKIAYEGFLWKTLFAKDFPTSKITPISESEWKLAYQMSALGLDINMRCFRTKQTFLEDTIGLGVDYTVNPKTKRVDYISVSQDLLSRTAFHKHLVRSDVFGNQFRLFLPLYFSREHFRRALPAIQRTIVNLCPERRTSRFEPTMVLDVIPKIVTTFVVLLSDEGVSACQKSYEGFTRIHRLFLALAQEYPSIQREAVRRLADFTRKEETRDKKVCPNLGTILPLLMIVNKTDFDWAKIRSAYLTETFDRSVLWACKKYPQLEKTTGESQEQGYERVRLTCEAMNVPLRLTMFHVYFLKAACQGTVLQRCAKYDTHFFQSQHRKSREPKAEETTIEAAKINSNSHVFDFSSLSFEHFRDQTNTIFTISTWKKFFNFVGVVAPATKDDMAKLLRVHVNNSRRRKYHQAGMDFSKIHASGTSKILSKGQQFSASAGLKRVVFEDHWTFDGYRKYLDATCLLYSNKNLEHTVDFSNRSACDGAVTHSGDVMEGQSGTHTINIDLEALPSNIVACVFVISAWSSATLKDITSASVAFRDADAAPSADPLCIYDLESHNKVSHLKSVIMCKLYRKSNGAGWHVLAIGDSNSGSASNYSPIYAAVKKLLAQGGQLQLQRVPPPIRNGERAVIVELPLW